MKVLGTDPPTKFDLQELFLEKTEGVPLFIEELAKSLIEQGALERDAASWRLAVSADELRIPDTVQGIILARFDHLSDELKQVLQAAAVLGPQVAYRVLAVLVRFGVPTSSPPGCANCNAADSFARKPQAPAGERVRLPARADPGRGVPHDAPGQQGGAARQGRRGPWNGSSELG